MNTPGAPRIRPMADEDLAQVLEMAGSLENVPRWPPAAWLAALDPAAKLRRIALVAERAAGAEICGFAVSAVLPPQAELETIAVSPELRRKGMGSRLIAALMEELRRAGIREMFLEVRDSNREAKALYRRLGFSESGRRARYYVDPIEDAILMKVKIP
ncbi:MAG TPA: ribosomal protein S18-alanine N-acetyltransferase [Terracidiphilus sp.]|nr:ribosomal protein S18-alanine N-acetyltransferase [Terracidiphilus sp.]